MVPQSKLFATLLSVLLLAGLAACGGAEDANEPAETAGGEAASPATADDTAAAPTGEGVEKLGSATVTGTVVYEGEVPNLKSIDMSADPACAEKNAGKDVKVQTLVLGEDQKSLGNVFVYVKSGLPEHDFGVPAEPTVIDQEGCVYEPHVAGTMAGQEVMFKNSDGVLHNVHALPEVNAEFNMAMPPSLEEASRTFDQPEDFFRVKCDVHPWMNAYVRVMEHPYFDTTVEDGQFSIDGLPAGTYEIEAWHERLGTQTQTVTVEDGGSATAEFTFAR